MSSGTVASKQNSKEILSDKTKVRQKSWVFLRIYGEKKGKYVCHKKKSRKEILGGKEKESRTLEAGTPTKRHVAHHGCLPS